MNLTDTKARPAVATAGRVDLAVEATGLVKRFGDVVAVDGIDLRVNKGEVFGVLGPNGAGKTTMLRMLATLLSIDGGQARIFGVDVASKPHQIRQLVGVTGQYASVDENLTATENLWLFGRLVGLKSKVAKARAAELLGRFGLEDAASRQIKTFSGGMRRRLDLAASLISRPPLIFLDEPTTGLDPRTRGQMWDTIRELIRDGATVLLTTQYLDEADQLADRIAVVDRGRKVAEGTPNELKAGVGDSTLYVQLTDADRAGGADPRRRAGAHARGGRPVHRPARPQPRRGRTHRAAYGRDRYRDGIGAPAHARRGLPRHHRSLHRRRARPAGVPMSTLIIPASERRLSAYTSPRDTISHTVSMAWRALKKMQRNPEQFFDVIIQPLLFTAMFTYIFGGAIAGDVKSYLPTIITGILAQTSLTACMATGTQMREDMDKGVFDRFRSLPMSRIAPLAGPMAADVLRYGIAATLTVLTGLLMGYRPGGGILGVAAGWVLVVFAGWALSWIFAWLGTLMRTAQAVQGVGMMIMFPLTFLSNAFVPTRTLPGWLQAFVKVNPVTLVINATRDLMNDGAFTTNVAWALLGCAAVVAVFGPLAVLSYNRKVG
jgi:ABC transporter DrrB family efflux protein